MPALSEEDIRELSEVRAPYLAPDAVSIAIGTPVYIRHYRTSVRSVLSGRRLTVSRWYYGADPPVAVDFQLELGLATSEAEVTAKRAWCKRQGARYVLLEDEWDEAIGRVLQSPQTGAQGFTAVPTDAMKPITAPRRRNVCACGCGEPVGVNSRWRPGHNKRG